MYFYLPSLPVSRIRALFVVLTLSGLVGCGGLSPLSLLTGGGPNVAAAVPIAVGETVDQNLGISIKSEAPTVRLEPNAKVGKIDQSTTNNTSVDPWVILLLILGWLAPSPNEIARPVRGWFRLKRT